MSFRMVGLYLTMGYSFVEYGVSLFLDKVVLDKK